MLNNDEERDSQEEDEGRMTTTLNQQWIYTERAGRISRIQRNAHKKYSRFTRDSSMIHM